LKAKKLEKLRQVRVNREDALRTREIELKKQEKVVRERLAKMEQEREERIKKAQED